MVFQVFQNNFNILYVDGDKRIIAERLINQYNYHYPAKKLYKYINEYNSKEEIKNVFKGYFIDGFHNETYLQFIKEKGLVNLMCNYWNQVIYKEDQMNLNAQRRKQKPRF